MARFYEIQGGEVINLDCVMSARYELPQQANGWVEVCFNGCITRRWHIFPTKSSPRDAKQVFDEILALGRGMPETQYTRTIADSRRYTPRMWTYHEEPQEEYRR